MNNVQQNQPTDALFKQVIDLSNPELWVEFLSLDLDYVGLNNSHIRIADMSQISSCKKMHSASHMQYIDDSKEA